MSTKKRSKYNIDTTKKGKQNRTYNGIEFDSELEMKYYRDVVCVGFKDGTIKDCKLQVKYELQPKFKHNNKTIQAINYVADFVITYADNTVSVIDTKGLPDATAKLKRKMMWYTYPDLNYQWVGFSKIDGGWVDYEVIQKGRSQRRKAKAATTKKKK